MIQSDEIKLPAEFQVALYENLIQQLGKKAGFLHVYRDGDRNAANVATSSFSTAPFAGSSREVRRSGRLQLSQAQPQLRFIAGSPTAKARYCWSRM